MGSSVPAGQDDDVDESEMTSVMGAEQRRALQQAAREAAAAAAKSAQEELPTAPPPPPTSGAHAVALPKPPAVPTDIGHVPEPRASDPPESKVEKKEIAKAGVVGSAPAASPAAWSNLALVAFVLLAAAIAFALR